MTMTLFLLGTLLVMAVVWSIRTSRPLRQRLAAKTARTKFPELVSVTLLGAQVFELVTVVERATFVNMSVAGMILVILLAVRSGTEGDMH